MTCSSRKNGRHGIIVDGGVRVRKRCRFDKMSSSHEMFVDINIAWKALFESRWPEGRKQFQDDVALPHLDGGIGCDFGIHSGNWQQMYWEAHIQDCLGEAAEMALLPTFEGCVGEIAIPDSILKSIGCGGDIVHTFGEYVKLSYHCLQFGRFPRYLRLQNVLCVSEICDLLKDSQLQGLLFRSIKSKIHINGVCRLLNQNRHTLLYLQFIYCRLPVTCLNEICHSLFINGFQRHGIHHFMIKSSSILECNQVSVPSGFLSFLSGSSLRSLIFCDNSFGPDFSKIILDTLLDSSSYLSMLEISESNISGWLSKVKWMFTSCSESLGVEKSLRSLCDLKLRGNHWREDDVEDLKSALHHMPNLQRLDISDNPIGDGGIRCLLSYINQFYQKASSLVDIRVENCGLSHNGVTQLLQSLSTLREPLKTLSVADNELGCDMATPLAKFMQTSHVKILNIEDIGLGSSGFLELTKELHTGLELTCINISKNRGGIEAANFVSKLILLAPELVSINAGYNLMPAESLVVICAALKLSKGKLELLDLTGNTRCCKPANESMHAHLTSCGRPILSCPSQATSMPYDDDV